MAHLMRREGVVPSARIEQKQAVGFSDAVQGESDRIGCDGPGVDLPIQHHDDSIKRRKSDTLCQSGIDPSHDLVEAAHALKVEQRVRHLIPTEYHRSSEVDGAIGHVSPVVGLTSLSQTFRRHESTKEISRLRLDVRKIRKLAKYNSPRSSLRHKGLLSSDAYPISECFHRSTLDDCDSYSSAPRSMGNGNLSIRILTYTRRGMFGAPGPPAEYIAEQERLRVSRNRTKGDPQRNSMAPLRDELYVGTIVRSKENQSCFLLGDTASKCRNAGDGASPASVFCAAGTKALRSFGPEVQRFVGQKFVELRSRKYVAQYDLRLLLNGFAYWLIMGLAPKRRQASIVLSRALVSRSLGQVNVMVENAL